MILDTLDNLSRYKSLNDRFSEAIRFLQRPDLRDLPAERHEIKGEDVFALVLLESGKKKEDGLLEAHKKYIDIQVVLGGTDEMGWKPTSECKESKGGYKSESDVELFHDQPVSWVATHPGQFAIFFPEDAHMPMISDNELHKVVVKIALT